MQTNFISWMQEKAKSKVNEHTGQLDPFITMQQQAGDFVYFGVHDLSKMYKQSGQLPDLTQQDVSHKLGKIVDADPVNQTVTIETLQAPYKYGYKKLERKSDQNKRKADLPGSPVQVTIPVNSLMTITHMMNTKMPMNLWLVVDANTKYQAGLIKAIRKKEFERAHGMEMPEPNGYNPVSPDAQQQFLAQGRQLMPNPQHPQNKTPTQMPMEDEDYHLESFNPSAISYDRCWKYHSDNRKYKYYG